MSRALPWLVAAIALFASRLSSAEGEQRADCKYNDRANSCMPYGCLPAPSLGPEPDPDLNQNQGNAGFCGLCRKGHDEDCAGAHCRDDGTCSAWPAAPPPPSVWPHFSLLVGDASLGFQKNKDVQPILGVGYVFQGAFVSVKPTKEVGGGPYVAENLPWLYWNVGATGAFAGESQNVFLDLGLTAYYPGFPLAITIIGTGALYQREGAAIWKFGNTVQNQDRLGPDLTIGFLQNLFVRGAWLFPLRGDEGASQFVLSILYMRDLAGDLVPDRFQKYLPAAFR